MQEKASESWQEWAQGPTEGRQGVSQESWGPWDGDSPDKESSVLKEEEEALDSGGEPGQS